tara:strand:- start:406 stop:633 length:228 start_codon:yes stop_codon:yes gene_type:complete
MNSIIEAQLEFKEQQIIEIEKCKASPYYFATNYLKIKGKPFTTWMSESLFNKLYNILKQDNYDKRKSIYRSSITQ